MAAGMDVSIKACWAPEWALLVASVCQRVHSPLLVLAWCRHRGCTVEFRSRTVSNITILQHSEVLPRIQGTDVVLSSNDHK